MTARLPLLLGMLLSQGATLALLWLTHERSEALLEGTALAAAALVATALLGAALEGRALLMRKIASEALGVAVLAVAIAFFLKARDPRAFAWGLVAFQACLNLRLATRREVLFSLLCGLGVLLVATALEWDVARSALLLVFAAGAVLALAAAYYLGELSRAEQQPRAKARLFAPGAFLYGMLPALLLAAPLFVLQVELAPHAVPFRLPMGGVVYAEPPPAAADERDDSEEGGLLLKLGALWGPPGDKDKGRAKSATPQPAPSGLPAPVVPGPGPGALQGEGPGGAAKGASLPSGGGPGKDGRGPGPDPGDTPGGTYKDSDDQAKSGTGDSPRENPPEQGAHAGETPAGGGRPSEETGEQFAPREGDADGRGGSEGAPRGPSESPFRTPADILAKGERDFPGGVCVPRPHEKTAEKKEKEKKKPKESRPRKKQETAERPRPPQRDACAFHVLNPYHHPALYRFASPNPASSTVLQVQSSQPLYLREQVYDRYENGTWECARRDEQVLVKDRANRYFIDDRHTQAVQNVTVQVHKPITNMVPVALRPEFLRWGVAKLGVNEDYAISAPNPLRAGQSYYLESVLRLWDQRRPTTDIDTRPENPDHLQVPEKLSAGLERLAREATRGERQTLAVAEALEWHFRNHYRHALGKLAAEGEPGEPLLDFLEGSREGNAELFATAFVLAARATGLRARLVVGHLATRRNPAVGNEYRVHLLDAHAWAEVRIGRYWTTFDPTPIRDLPGAGAAASGGLAAYARYLDSLSDLAQAFDEDVPDSGLPDTVWESLSTSEERALVRGWRAIRWLMAHGREIAIALVLAIAAGGVWLRYRERLRCIALAHRLDPRAAVIGAYAAAEALFAGLGYRRAAAQNHVVHVARLSAAFPALASPLGTLGNEFGRARYGGDAVLPDAAARAVGAYSSVVDARASLRRPERPAEDVPESAPPARLPADPAPAARATRGFSRRHR